MATKAHDNVAKFTHRLKNTQMFSFYYTARAQSLQNMKNAQKKQTLDKMATNNDVGVATAENTLVPELVEGVMPENTVANDVSAGNNDVSATKVNNGEGGSNMQVQLPNGTIVATSAKVAAQKHHRETDSQFRKRQDIKVAAEQKHIEELRGKASKNATGSIGKPQCSYIDSMAKYYSAKTRKARRRTVAKALIVLKPIIMRLYWIVVDNRYLRGVIAIQAAARGYVIRNSIEYVVDVLIGRKLHRLMATLILRNWIRKYIVGYYDKFQVRQLNNPTVRKVVKVLTPISVKAVTIDDNKKPPQLAPAKVAAFGTGRNMKITPTRAKSPLRSQYSSNNADTLTEGGAVLQRHPTSSSVLSGVSTASTAVASIESAHSNSTHPVLLNSGAQICRASTTYGGFGVNSSSKSEADAGLDKPKRVSARTSSSTITNTNKQRRATITQERTAPVVTPPRVVVVDANPAVPTYSQVAGSRAKLPIKNDPLVQVPPVPSHTENAPVLEAKLPAQLKSVPSGSGVISGIQNHAVSFAPESLPPPSSAVAQENNSALNNRSSVDASVGSANADNVTPVVPEVEVSKISDTPKKDDVVVDNSRSHASTKPLVEQKATQQYSSIAPAINKKIEISDSAASLSSVAANGDQRSRAGECSSRTVVFRFPLKIHKLAVAIMLLVLLLAV